MPSRNILKTDVARAYYHVYSRGINRQVIFHDDQDHSFFLSLFKRYLSTVVGTDKKGVAYPHFASQINLLAYCLMPNHIHLLVYQIEPKAMQGLMRAVLTSYSTYYNRKYGRRGPLFESRYKASHISKDAYLEHISRYIHLNPAAWEDYPYSSLKYYENRASAEWLKPEAVLEMFESTTDYTTFLKDYQSQKDQLEELKYELADK